MPAGDAGLEQQPVRLVVDLPRVGHRRGCPDGTEPRHHACWFDEGGGVVRVRKASREEMAAEIDRLQAQLAAQQAVVDAARAGLEYIANLTWTLPEAYAAANQMQERAFYDLGRMDKAQVAQPEGA